MTKHTGFRAAMFGAVACFLRITAKATTVIRPKFEEMTDRACLIFVGKVVGSRAEWRSVGTNRGNFTLVEFETQVVLKGNAGRSAKHARAGGWDMLRLTRLV